MQRTTKNLKGSSTRKGLNRYVPVESKKLYRAYRESEDQFGHEYIDDSCHLIRWIMHSSWEFAIITKRYANERPAYQIIEPISGQYIANADSIGEAKRIISDKMKAAGGIDGLRAAIDNAVNIGCLSPAYSAIKFQVVPLQ